MQTGKLFDRLSVSLLLFARDIGGGLRPVCLDLRRDLAAGAVVPAGDTTRGAASLSWPLGLLLVIKFSLLMNLQY